jgi:hypothetical protein
VFERFTDSARQVLVLAQEEARLIGHSFIGTEHILLGLLHQEGAAAEVLIELGASLPIVRERVQETIGVTGTPSGSPPFTPRAKKVLELSLREALQHGHHNIGTELLLLGLIREGEGVACQVLVSQGIDLGEVRQHVMQRLVVVESARSTDDLTLHTSTPAGSVAQGRMVVCSFCGLSPPESGQLVSGNDAFICEHCVGRWSIRLRPRARTRLAEQGWTIHTSVDLPSGQEPEDVDAVRAEIRAAYIASRVPSDDARSVPSVEKSDNLGTILISANERSRGIVGDGSDVIISADGIYFYDPTRAAVLFSISMGDRLLLGGQRGEAVLVDGVWKMARSTFAQLMALGGVECPPESE